MQLTYKFRLYPNKEQKLNLLNTLELCRQTYNILLEELNNQKAIDKSKIQGLLPDLKICQPELNQVYSKVLQYECYRLFSNLKALAQSKKNKRKIGRLRFKGKGWFKSFTFNQSGFKIMETGKRLDKLHLSKIGDIPIMKHRGINGKVKQITVKHYTSGRWYALISVEKEKDDKKLEYNNNTIGIDLGIINFVHDSNNNKFSNPKHFDKSLKKLKKESRKFSRKHKNSKNAEKQRRKLVRIHEKILNQRNDFLHKLSRYYVNNYNLIAIEDLNIIGLIRITYNAKNIHDASWNRFIRMLCYKAESAGSRVIKVNPRGTTQLCSTCKREIKKELWNRMHKCNNCGLKMTRDYNSAINILHKGIGLEQSKFTPVETGDNQSMKQETLITE